MKQFIWKPYALAQTFVLYLLTALAELVGCYLPMLWLSKRGPAWLLLPAAASLAAFVWLLSLHPAASGRVYAAYGGVYVAAALGWLWAVDGIRPGGWDLAGVALVLAGAAVIVLAPRS
ncbi:YnfA family protein [Chitinimonas koreensis]|uniref:YnfA family protein n=1 Tax=Chitinimonas koreensis TaxID=356302 RepID=UPI00223E9777|nr:YnfA family protein [Chitinimonas koreensis]